VGGYRHRERVDAPRPQSAELFETLLPTYQTFNRWDRPQDESLRMYRHEMLQLKLLGTYKLCLMNMQPAGSVVAVWRIRLRDVNACACVGLRVDFPN